VRPKRTRAEHRARRWSDARSPGYWKGEQVRDYIYVEDLARAHIQPLKVRVRGVQSALR
jgi:nucleoside-diphosphate-sugar epimerase